MLEKSKILYRCLYNNTDTIDRDNAVNEANDLFKSYKDQTNINAWSILFLERCVLKKLIKDLAIYNFIFIKQVKPWEAIFECNGELKNIAYRYVAPEDRYKTRTYHRVQKYTGNLGETKFKQTQSWDIIVVYTNASEGLHLFFVLKKDYFIKNAYLSKQDYDKDWLVINKKNLLSIEALKPNIDIEKIPYEFFNTVDIETIL